MNAPRCGRPMARYEAANGPMLEEPECARPAGHNGPCRTAPAVRRNLDADLARLAAATRPCACGCGETVRWGRRYLRSHNPRSEWGNWVRDGRSSGWPAARSEAA